MKKETTVVKDSSTLFLRLVVLGLGGIVAALCAVVLPLGIFSEGIGLYRWILVTLYIPAIPFFFALWQATKLLHFIETNTAFSIAALTALQKIRLCGLVIAGMFTAGMPYIYYVAEKDDAPGVIVIGLVIIASSTVVAVFAAVLSRLFQSALEIKAENDLTV